MKVKRILTNDIHPSRSSTWRVVYGPDWGARTIFTGSFEECKRYCGSLSGRCLLTCMVFNIEATCPYYNR